jgi:thiol:disulfide interchange protein
VRMAASPPPPRRARGARAGRGRPWLNTSPAALLAAALAWVAFTVAPADAQQGVPQPGSALERPAKWSLSVEPVPGSAERLQLLLHAVVGDGWYLYALSQPAGGPQPLEILLAEGSGFRIAGDIVAPRPRTYPDRTFNVFTAIHRGSTSFTVPIAANAPPRRDRQITAYVLYQTCNERYCLPPRTDTVTTMLRFDGAGAADRRRAETATTPVGTFGVANTPAPTTPPASPESTTGEEAGSSSGLEHDDEVAAAVVLPDAGDAEAQEWLVFGQAAGGTPDGAAAMISFLWLAFGMGLLSLLTPCVFPMVPLTVSYFGGPNAGSRCMRIRDAALFGAGILVTFTAVGFGFAVAFDAGSVVRLAASPWMNLAIAALFLLFALNLLGVLELRLPTRLMGGAARVGGGGRATGATLMGGAFAITSFTDMLRAIDEQ